ncbi:beta-N-acetylhexosaminidase [Actinomadura opuntiae]|uniref:beta-N-acetylhexosaminidase n=1 Tax=Actinomadura sp. OS1-43 TaxID=604315 RepID=UPI00255AB4D3|nr:beta-N-acetylhexosaminidase [Actinomadura sp. OS1-43]MDL4818486.1 beta-N-acetylhexosaminidase [Actinomadura sp. OS1-43]
MIIPRPAQLTREPGWFFIPPELHLTAGPGAEQSAELLSGYLGGSRPRTGTGPRIHLELLPAPGREDRSPGGYDLSIAPDQVTLTATGVDGLRNGVQTLRQLLPSTALAARDAGARTAGPPGDWRWPCLHIHDQPRLPWRGVMLDVARHFMPVEFLHEFIDQLALHHLNVLHLHLTDDQGWRIEIEELPELTRVGAWRGESMIGRSGSTRFDGTPHGGYYTRGQLRRLVAHAAERGVTIMPEIEMPGHAQAALAAYPHLGNHPDARLPVWTSWGINENIFGVHDAALDFCRRVLDATMEIFPSQHIHIGGEECPTVQWEHNHDAVKRAAQLGLDDVSSLHGWFLTEMRDFLAARGRTAVCWDETGELTDRLPEDMVLTAWRDPGHGALALGRKHQVIMAPHRWTYLDYRQSTAAHEPPGHPDLITTLADVYAYDPLAGGLPAARAGNGHRPSVLGAQAQIWTEFAPTSDHVLHLAYPRLCAFAEVVWTNGPHDLDDFRTRLAPHLQRLQALGAIPRPRTWWPDTPASGRTETMNP